MRNHQSRPTGFEPFPEVNAISSQTRGRGRWRDRGCGRNPQYHGSYSNNFQRMKVSLHHKKWNNTETKQENGKRLQNNLLRTMRIIVIDVVWRGIGRVLVVPQTFGRPLPSINKNKRKRDRDELYRWWWIRPNLLWQWFLWRSQWKNRPFDKWWENFDWCYSIYEIIYYYVLYLHLIFFVIYIMPCFFYYYI